MSSFRQLSFSSGEITPAVWGRVDLSKYSSGLKLCKNFIVMRHGGVANRPGTRFVGEVSDSTKMARFIRWVFSPTQTYLLEFGEKYMRVVLDGVHVKSSTKTITGATTANPCVITATGHGFSNGDEVYISGVLGMVELNVRNFKVANVTTNTFEITLMDTTPLDSTSYGTYTSGGTAEKVFELVTPYLEADLASLYFAQSADILELTRIGYAPRELKRLGDASWTLSVIQYGATIATPSGLASSASGAGNDYKVTAVSTDTGEESLPSTKTSSTTRTSTLSWTAVTGASTYNVYIDEQGLYSWIGIAGTNSFKDNSFTSDPMVNPPEVRLPFNAVGDYPSVVAFFQGRAWYANTLNAPETVLGSKSGLRRNMMISAPLKDNDPVTFTLAGVQVNSIRHIVGMDKLLVLTDSGEWAVTGGASNNITPFAIDPAEHTRNGTSSLRPLVAQGTILYVQARGSIVRDLNYDYQSAGYRGNELSIFSSHLFDNYTLKDWTYQQTPDSIVWAARSDGKVIAMTYIREHSVFGWHQHDFGGSVENVTSIPAGKGDRVFLLVKRTINGKSVRYIEYLETRLVGDIRDSVFMDSALSYDGRNTGTGTVTLTTGGGWTQTDTLTITSSAPLFVSGDVGNQIWVYDTAETSLVRVTIASVTSSTVASGTPHKTVPAEFQAVATANWSRAADQIVGLWHLEGEEVSILADGNVAANPLNTGYVVKTVINGIITLDRPSVVVHVGLPVQADIQTLDIDLPNVVLTDKDKQVGKVTLKVETSRGILAGVDDANMYELKIRDNEFYDDPINLATGNVEINIAGQWDNQGSVIVRQIDPLPLAVLSVVPSGYITGAKKRGK